MAVFDVVFSPVQTGWDTICGNSHFAFEAVCIATILYLLFLRDYDPKDEKPLTEREEDVVINAWKPKPLVPEMKEELDTTDWVVESASGRVARVGGKDILNFASNNYLGLANHPEIKRVCKETISQYGVGSCGPRGFYGTFDCHLDLEKAIAKLYGVDEAILYSDGLATIASVIAAFAKKGDMIICDSGICYGAQQGMHLSRATCKYFKHNDMEDLQAILQDIVDEDNRTGRTVNRRFVLVEGIYASTGEMCPLDKVIALKNLYKARLILDDSWALGALGKSGEGSPQHWGKKVVDDIDILVATVDNAISSVGGYCVGNHIVVDHQRLTGAGYVFSASSPPYTAVAATRALGLIQSDGAALVTKLRKNLRHLHQALGKISAIQVGGDAKFSPIITFKLRNRKKISEEEQTAQLKKVVQALFKEGVAVRRPQSIPAETNPCKPHLQVCVTAEHTLQDLNRAADAIKRVLRALI